MTSLTVKFAAAAVFASFLTGAAHAQTKVPFEGVVLVAAVAPQDISPPALRKSEFSQFERGKVVKYKTAAAPGSVIVETRKNVLYFVLGNGRAVKYRVATAKKGFEWAGTHQVSFKTTWPDWRTPASMRQRRPDLPAFMAGGADNPLGARAIYLGSTIYRIHGTNEPSSIGKAASSGCIRMLNEDVSELYRHIKAGASVTVI